MILTNKKVTHPSVVDWQNSIPTILLQPKLHRGKRSEEEGRGGGGGGGRKHGAGHRSPNRAAFN